MKLMERTRPLGPKQAAPHIRIWQMHRAALLIFSALASSLIGQTPSPPAGNDEVRKIMETYTGRGVLSDGSKPTPPQDALKSFKMREGFAIDLIANEPQIEQPLYMSFDSRGRLWVT